jgi:cytidylate kinase
MMVQKTVKPIVITIDGPAGAGKSTVAKIVAEKMGLPYLDTGAMYRAVAWWLSSRGVAPSEEERIKAELANCSMSVDAGRVCVCGIDVTDSIRSREIDNIVSSYAACGPVRDFMLSIERACANGGLVADGRDMGTVVFPDADVKIFLTASANERAMRRYKERAMRNEPADYDEILEQVNERDRYDMNRDIAPLRPARGCIILDSTSMTASEVAEAISSLAAEIGRVKDN